LVVDQEPSTLPPIIAVNPEEIVQPADINIVPAGYIQDVTELEFTSAIVDSILLAPISVLSTVICSLLWLVSLDKLAFMPGPCLPLPKVLVIVSTIVVSTINDVPFPIEAFLWMSEEGESAEAVFVLIFVSEALVKIVSVLFD
jgi:hypothetical protein